MQNGDILLTPAVGGQAGTAVKRNPMLLKSGFSTYFKIQMDGTTSTIPADGIGFIMYPSESSSPRLGNLGEYLGFGGISNCVGVEFDTYHNSGENDPGAYHVAIDTNGSVKHDSSTDTTSTDVNNPTNDGTTNMAHNWSSLYNNLVNVWVDYTTDGYMIVTYGLDSNRNSTNNYSFKRNIGTAFLSQDVLVGFSASTGGSNENHLIKSWLFSNQYVQGGLNPSVNYVQATASGTCTLDAVANPTKAALSFYDTSSNILPNVAYEIYLNGTDVGSGTTDATGMGSYAIPSSIPFGSNTVKFISQDGSVVISKTFTKAIVASATADNTNNDISINWANPDSNNPYTYQVYGKSSTDSVYQTLSTESNKTSIRVLDVYPDAWQEKSTTFTSALDGENYTVSNAAMLKSWMESANSDSNNGYGKGIISVDPLDITDFNANPTTYLLNSDGSYKYDVVVFGFWDGNMSEDLSNAAESVIDTYIQTGRGVLFGHDTASPYFSHTNFCTLAQKYTGVVPAGYNGGATFSTYGNTQVEIQKNGLLTNYPWSVGSIGTLLNTPMSHTYGEFATSDVWAVYPGNTWKDGASWGAGVQISSYQGFTGTNNFYLTTKNNTAMIQTGHSNGQATSGEEKMLANTIFYLAQLTSETSIIDHKGQDITPPNTPIITSVTNNSGSYTVNWNPVSDNGTSYSYYVAGTNENTNAVEISNTVAATNTSGIKGYNVTVDGSPTTTLTSNITTTNNSLSIAPSAQYAQNFYIHIAAVDNDGNISAVTTYDVDNTPPTGNYNLSTTNWTTDNVTINVDASDIGTGVSSITEPDGTVVIGNTCSYAATDNGIYSFTITDNAGNSSTYPITVSNIDRFVTVSYTSDMTYSVDPNNLNTAFSSTDVTLTNKNSHVGAQVTLKSLIFALSGVNGFSMGAQVEESTTGNTTWSEIDNQNVQLAGGNSTVLGVLSPGGTGHVKLVGQIGSRRWENPMSYDGSLNLVFTAVG